MKSPMSRSRKTLHLRRQRTLSTTAQTAVTAATRAASKVAISATRNAFDRDGKTGRIIEIRYRGGASITVGTAVDMRKKFFSSTHEFN